MKTDDQYTEYMFTFVDTICKKFGPRYSCSQAEKDANLWIRDELDKFCDETFIDEFETHPGLYPIGIFKIFRLLGAISFIFMPIIFPWPILSTICVFVALFVFITELFFMKEWISPLFKKGTSSNAWGIIKPTGETKFRIIFEGHTDSAIQMKIASFDEKPPLATVIIGFYFLIHTIIFSLVKFFGLLNGSIAQSQWWIFSWTIIDWIYFISLVILYPLFLKAVGGFLGDTVVLGANDNLSASATAAAIGKYLSQNRPKNVEVWVGSQGSEEVGDKGAKAFVKKYGEMGKLDDCYSVVLDASGAGTEIFIIHKDTMHRATHSMEIIERFQKAHDIYMEEDPNALKCGVGRILLGSSDACRYAHAGYKTVCIIVMDGALNKPRHWHSIHDTPENLEKKVLKEMLETCLNFVEIVDKEYN